jgi:hypothetical protein
MNSRTGVDIRAVRYADGTCVFIGSPFGIYDGEIGPGDFNKNPTQLRQAVAFARTLHTSPDTMIGLTSAHILIRSTSGESFESMVERLIGALKATNTEISVWRLADWKGVMLPDGSNNISPEQTEYLVEELTAFFGFGNTPYDN